MTPISLDISIVTYKTDLLGLKIALISLCQTIERARERLARQLLVSLFIVENAPRHPTPPPSRLAASRYLRAFDAIHHVQSPTNVGFGRGHNLAIFDERGATADYHLVLNPDVELDPDALRLCIEYLEATPEAVAVVPNAVDGSNEPCYLAKAQPSVVVLASRAYLPGIRLPWLRKRLERYELRPAADRGEIIRDVPNGSGCFFFARARALREVGGFAPQYFLYFEDFDLSNRLRRLGRMDYLPQVRLIHHGGNVGRKGLHHLAYFSRSAIRFFNRWGWRFC